MGLAPLVSWNDSVVCHHRPFLRCCKGNHSLRNWQVICDFFSSCSDFGIFRHRDLVLNTLMRALGVVVFNVVLDAFTQFLDIIRGIDNLTYALVRKNGSIIPVPLIHGSDHCPISIELEI